MIDWDRVRKIMEKSVRRGGDLGRLDESYLYKAIAEDSKRYRALHAEVKREAVDEMVPK